ncbi:MAG: helix-turn-helix transcriptional regulator [Bacteroidota bacterium]
MYLGPNIKRIRRKWRYQQEEFAQLMSSTKGRISQYELGNNDPKIPFLLRLERLSGVACSILYTRLIKDDEISAQPLETEFEIPPNTVKEVQEPEANHARKVSKGILVWMEYMEHRVKELEDQLNNNNEET